MDIKRFFDLLSDYMDHDLEQELCSEMEILLEEDRCCRCFYNTFSKTLDLCRKIREEEFDVPEEIHVRLIQKLRIEFSDAEED